MSNTISDIDKKVKFIQHHLPAITAGEYTLDVEISMTDTSVQALPLDIDGDDETISSYAFAVRGDRYRILEQKEVLYSVYPFSGKEGDYSTVLPHVVFTKKIFPWIRSIGGEQVESVVDSPRPTDDDVPTWLGLLLFDGNEIELKTGTIQDLIDAGVGTINGYVSYQSSLEIGEDPTDTIQYIDLPKALFDSVAPSVDDLNLLAHAREVSLDPKATIPGISDQGTPVGDFSIVFGNRLPAAPVVGDENKSDVFLVCLEEMEDYLPNKNGIPSIVHSYDFIRLAVLTSWSFQCVTETSANFVEKVENLSSSPLKISAEAFDAGQSPNSTDDLIQDAFSMGYVPLSHDLRTNEKTISWYRSPLTPYEISNGKLDIPISSPDKATIFDPTTGMLDVSYAMAWTLGKMLSLQNKAFSTSLYHWKKNVEADVIKSVEEDMIEERFQIILDADDADDADVTVADVAYVADATNLKRSSPSRKSRKKSVSKRLYTGLINRLISSSKK